MKKLLLLLIGVIVFSSCSMRIGDLTMISNRNIEFSKKQKEIKRDVSGKSYRVQFFGIRFGSPNMEEAIDNCIKKEGKGEYLTNCTITMYYHWYVIFGMNGVKVHGDLHGYDE